MRRRNGIGLGITALVVVVGASMFAGVSSTVQTTESDADATSAAPASGAGELVRFSRVDVSRSPSIPSEPEQVLAQLPLPASGTAAAVRADVRITSLTPEYPTAGQCGIYVSRDGSFEPPFMHDKREPAWELNGHATNRATSRLRFVLLPASHDRIVTLACGAYYPVDQPHREVASGSLRLLDAGRFREIEVVRGGSEPSSRSHVLAQVDVPVGDDPLDVAFWTRVESTTPERATNGSCVVYVSPDGSAEPPWLASTSYELNGHAPSRSDMSARIRIPAHDERRIATLACGSHYPGDRTHHEVATGRLVVRPASS